MTERFDLEKSCKNCKINIHAESADEGRDFNVACRMILKALEEIQQYRAIGTVEELTALKENCIEPSSLRLYLTQLEKYRAIGTIEEFKALKEKNTPYKPLEYEDRYYACKCDNILLPKWRKYPTELMPKSEGLPYCMACGQAIDWSKEK